MTATNICYNFVGFRCSPPVSARLATPTNGKKKLKKEGAVVYITFNVL